MWKWHSLETLWQDVRYALRTMRRNPGFTIVALSTIALGIGANTAVFSLINVLMLRKLPVREPGHLVEFLWQYPGDPRRNFFGPTNYEQYRDQNSVFSDLIGTSSFRFEPGDERMGAETLDGEYVTGNFFPALEVRPAIGRLIGPQDDRPGTAPVAVVSWSYWKTRFNLDPAILDTRIDVDGVPATVIGVTPRDFFGLQIGYRPDVWMPAAVRRTNSRLAFKLMGRLRPGVSITKRRASRI